MPRSITRAPPTEWTDTRRSSARSTICPATALARSLSVIRHLQQPLDLRRPPAQLFEACRLVGAAGEHRQHRLAGLQPLPRARQIGEVRHHLRWPSLGLVPRAGLREHPIALRVQDGLADDTLLAPLSLRSGG